MIVESLKKNIIMIKLYKTCKMQNGILSRREKTHVKRRIKTHIELNFKINKKRKGNKSSPKYGFFMLFIFIILFYIFQLFYFY